MVGVVDNTTSSSLIAPETQKEIVRRYLAGESTLTLAKVYGTHKHKIRKVLVINQIPRRKNGERPPYSNATLYKIDQDTFRRMVNDKMTKREIAHALGISMTSVQSTAALLKTPLATPGEQALLRRSHPVPDNLFGWSLNPEQSWLLGLLMTDGCVTDRGVISLRIADQDGVQYARNIIGFGNIRKQPIPKGGTSPTWNLTVGSPELARRLSGWGCTPRKTKTLQFPPIANLSLPDFIRGLWDGDGSWSIPPSTDNLICLFGCASKPFIEALYEVISPISGSKAIVRKYGDFDFWKIGYSGKAAIRLAQWAYYDTNAIGLARKRAVVAPYLQLPSRIQYGMIKKIVRSSPSHFTMSNKAA